MTEGVTFYALAALVGILVAFLIANRHSGRSGDFSRGGTRDRSKSEEGMPTARWTEWDSSFFELLVHLGPTDDARLRAAIQALWRGELLAGPTASPKGKPAPSLTVSPRDSGDVWFYGKLRLASSPPIDCCLITTCGEIADDLLLYVPRGILETHFGPGRAAAAGTQEIQSAFLRVADRLNKVVPFKLGAIGEEILAAFPSREVLPGYKFEEELADYLAAAERGLGTISGSEVFDALSASGGVLLSSELKDRAALPNISVTVLPSGLLWLSRPQV